MKILIIHNFYLKKGGEDTTVFSEKRILEENGHLVYLYTKSNEEFKKGNLFERIFKIFEIFFSFATYRELKKIIKKFKPDVIHVHNIFLRISPSVYFIAKKYNIPVVQTLHNYRFLCLNGLFLLNNGKICEKCKNGNFIYGVINRCYRNSFFQSLIVSLIIFIYRKIFKTFTKKIDIFISPSNFLKRKMKGTKDFRKAKIIFKPHFVEVKKDIDIEKFEDYVLYLGRISKEKGILTLLEGFEKIKNFRLVIAGDGPLVEEVKEIIQRQKLNNVSFIGYLNGDKKDSILRKASVTVLPSEWYENMPYSILESFAYGVPVIASCIGGLRELVIDGYNGLLFEHGNSEDLADKVAWAWNHPKEMAEMGWEARKEYERKYTAEKNYEMLMEIYKLAKEKAGR